MVAHFKRGQKARLSDLTLGTDLYVGVQISGPGLVFDISCFGLDAAEQLSDDRYFIFYNQPKSPEESLQQLGAQAGDTESFRITLDRVPESIHRLTFTATIDGDGTMAQVAPGCLRIVAGGDEVVRYAFDGSEFSTERAVMLGDFYRKDGWRFAAVGQGFDGGLAALLTHFGGEVEDDEPPATAPPAAPAGQPPAFAVPGAAGAGAQAPPAPGQGGGFSPPPFGGPPGSPPQAQPVGAGTPAAFGGPPGGVAGQPPAAPPFGGQPGAAPQVPGQPVPPGGGFPVPPGPQHAGAGGPAAFVGQPGAGIGQPPPAPPAPPFGGHPGQPGGGFPAPPGAAQPPPPASPFGGYAPPPGAGAGGYVAPPGAGAPAGQFAPAGGAAPGALTGVLDAFRGVSDGRRWSQQNPQLIRVDLTHGGGQPVLARQGSMVMYHGDVDFGYKSQGLMGRMTRWATGEGMPSLMRCTGNGQVYLAEEAVRLHPVELQGDAIVVASQHVLAFDESLEPEVRRIDGHGIPGGSLFALQFQGHGTVVITTHGEPLVLPVTPMTFADANAIVAWSAGAQVLVANQVRLRRHAYPGHSGETTQLQFRGAPGNFAIVQPYEI
ncbi:TerD family protein [Streptomyces hainanensis]|uniref:Stress protein n=1 Tax=Streptomyces hainanensis TaxID=402648 RepID=A0A4R4TMM5_9ACTN|nr:TerD family protein [Streptomyces hainanensis]TDC75309.1 stress protein [Streptomyces hainanensis]